MFLDVPKSDVITREKAEKLECRFGNWTFGTKKLGSSALCHLKELIIQILGKISLFSPSNLY